MVFSACLDTCVLVPSLLRDVLLEIGRWRAYRPIWSTSIEEELERIITRHHTQRGLSPEQNKIFLNRLFKNMNSAFPDARVDLSSNQITIDQSHLPDPDDAHVIEAALVGQAAVIVTFNLKDFPDKLLPNSLFAQHPDEFLLDLLHLDNGRDLTLNAISAVSARTGRKGQYLNEEDLLIQLGKSNVKKFAKEAIEHFQRMPS